MFDIIKKQNGEHFAKAIRNYDNGIFDIPNLDKIVKHAGRDAEPIMSYLVSLKKVSITEMSVHRDPIQMLDEAGYDAYVANTLEKQNAISKYFASGEALCTFRDPDRFKKYHIINAVRKDVDKIQRSPNPQREDEYGTSVISIQILKTGGFISIKNRYNHTVQNPDNTLNSDPDRIIFGLSDAIKHYFSVDFSAQSTRLPPNYLLINDQICKYDMEQDNVYFAENFYVKDGNIIDLNKESEIMIEPVGIFNIHTRKFSRLATSTSIDIGDALEGAFVNKKIHIIKNPDNSRTVTADNVPVFTVKDGDLIQLNTPNAEKIHLSGLSLHGDHDFSNVKTLEAYNTGFDSYIKFNTNAKEILLSNIQLKNDRLDFDNVQYIYVWRTDLSKKQIKVNKNAKHVSLKHTTITNPLDLSNVERINLEMPTTHFMDQVQDIKINPNAELVNLAHTIIKGTLDLHNVNQISLTGMHSQFVKNVIFNPNAQAVSIKSSCPPGDLNFTNVQDISLEEIDMSGVKFNSNAQKIELMNCKNTPQSMDFSHVKKIYLKWIDLDNCKFNPNAEEILLHNTNLSGDLDFSHVKKLTITQCDLTHVTSIKLPQNADEVTFEDDTGLMGTLNFGASKKITLANMNFSNVGAITFAPQTEQLTMEEITNIKCNLDFSNIDTTCLCKLDLSDTNVKFKPDASVIKLEHLNGLRGVLDFSHVRSFISYNMSYFGVEYLKPNPNAEEIRFVDTTWAPPMDCDFHNVKTLDLGNFNFTNRPQPKFNQNAKMIMLSNAYGLSGFFDFSNVEYISWYHNDLMDIRGLKFPQSLDNFSTDMLPEDMKRLAIQYATHAINGKMNHNNLTKDNSYDAH